ncbi:hypothetical protein N7451_008772 [Penicillium sp. IBT 35674x]|nr:hypothetical protein N7451_008772 [Penicillium sp. IBT 35674x]
MSSQSLTSAELAAWSDTRQPTIYGICALMLLLGNTSVPLRIWAQWKVHKQTFTEDYFLIAAVIFANIGTIATMVAASNGLGLHTWRVEAQDSTFKSLVGVFSSIWVTALFNGPSVFATKVALLLYYRRLFIVHQTWLKLIWWINFIFTSMLCLGITLFYILQCRPINWYWERANPYSTEKHGTCVASVNLIGIPLILSTISELSILFLPIMTILGLNMDMKRRVGVAAVFSVGFIPFGCSLARVIVLMAGTELGGDDTWSFVGFELLSAVELTFAIICASAVPIFSYIRLVIRGGGPQDSRDSFSYKIRPPMCSRNEHVARLPSSSLEHLSKDYAEHELEIA